MTPGSKRLKAGSLLHRLSIQSPVERRAESGEVAVVDWRHEVYRWGSVEALTGQELWLAQQTQSDATYRLRFRPVPGLLSRWSALWGTRRFRFGSPPLDPVGDGEQVSVLAVEQES
jgi:head-tail adaptor